MRKYISAAALMAILAGIFCISCTEDNDNSSATTTMRTTLFTGAEGGCEDGGVKIEVLINDVPQADQTQYVCGGTIAQNGMQNASIQATAFDGAQGSCNDGGIKVELLVGGSIQADQTQYICNETNGQDGNSSLVIDDITTLTFGHYEQDNDTTNGKEPITWIVLDKNTEGQYLVISEKVLDFKQYDEQGKQVTWERSSIRSWLNGYEASYNADGEDYTSDNFIDKAFTAEEKSRIVESNVPAHPNPNSYKINPGNPTTDKIFLLSVFEAEEYFGDHSSCKADATEYLANQSGVYTVKSDGHKYVFWWLRSPAYGLDKAARVMPESYYGDILAGSVDSNTGVRPAMWVNYP